MFRKGKKEDKAKLEHKLYLARENPEPIFDLSECGLKTVPTGIYSLCRVFLKETLDLSENQLASLSGGGNLKDLRLLKILNLNNNFFGNLPDDIGLLANLTELHMSNNQLKVIPPALCGLKKLELLDVSNNVLKALPDDIGNLSSLCKLNVIGNSGIKKLAKSICKAQRLHDLQIDANGFVYPPESIVLQGTESILKYICDDTGFPYDCLQPLLETQETPTDEDGFKAKIWTLEKLKEQKLQGFLEIERNNELLQRQEFELAMTSKTNREKLLSEISQQQAILDLQVAKLQQTKDVERFKLIEQLLEVEQNADVSVKQLLALNREPLIQLLEQEKQEEERLLAAAAKYNENLSKTEVLKAMEELLVQETRRFREYHESRCESARSILEQELISHTGLADLLQNKENQQTALLYQLQEDVELQKVAVGALLERGDARSWGLVQQVRLVELQLAGLTCIELDRRKLQMDEQLKDLEEKRAYLSELLVDLLQRQEERRAQLLATLKTMEEKYKSDDFWLRQYQNVLERTPSTIREMQKNIHPGLAQTLLMAGVLHCLPFLAHLIQTEGDVQDITDDDIKNAGVTNTDDRQRILEAFRLYSQGRAILTHKEEASAPALEDATAPLPEPIESTVANECVVCMEVNCDIIFVPCGHLCCCCDCSGPLADCPLCRGCIERKIRIYKS